MPWIDEKTADALSELIAKAYAQEKEKMSENEIKQENVATRMPKHNFNGQRFGRWLVIGLAPPRNYQNRWLCKCDCGKIQVVAGRNLSSGHSKSCGCYRAIVNIALHKKYTDLPVDTHSTEYLIFLGARSRCQNAKNPAYKHYGGRGIEFRLDSFEQFFSLIGHRPSESHSLNRIDNDGHYEPGNIEWATQVVQANNTRHNRMITYGGITKTMKQWADFVGIDSSALKFRLDQGWCTPCALTIPSCEGVCLHKAAPSRTIAALPWDMEGRGRYER